MHHLAFEFYAFVDSVSRAPLEKMLHKDIRHRAFEYNSLQMPLKLNKRLIMEHDIWDKCFNVIASHFEVDDVVRMTNDDDFIYFKTFHGALIGCTMIYEIICTSFPTFKDHFETSWNMFDKCLCRYEKDLFNIGARPTVLPTTTVPIVIRNGIRRTPTCATVSPNF